MINKISIFLKSGGGDKAASLKPLIRNVSSIFDELSQIEFITPFVQLHIEFRVDGDVYSFDDPEGCSNLKFLKKKNTIANTIAIKEINFRTFNDVKSKSLNYISTAIDQMLIRLIKEQYFVEKNKLMNELETKLKNIQ